MLEGISLSVPAGARLAVFGRNGMGKTTLLATLAGQTRRYEGSILGYVPQARCVFPTLTVEENLFVGLKTRPETRWRKPMPCSRD